MGPSAGHRRQTADRKELRRSVAGSREAVTDAYITAPGMPIEPRKADDFRFREPGDARCPTRVSRSQMRLEPLWIVGIARHVSAVGVAFLEQYVHDCTGQRAVGAGERRQVQIGLVGSGG